MVREHKSHRRGPQITGIGPYDPNLAPKPPGKWRGWWVGGGLALVVLLGAGVWFGLMRDRPAPSPSDASLVAPEVATGTMAAVETPEAPVVPDLPFGMAAGLAAGEAAEAAAQYGGMRIVANAPDYAQEFLAKTAKRYRMDTNAWAAVATNPHTLTNQLCGLVDVALEADGFKADPASRSVLIQTDRTNDVSFALRPLPATLKITCNVTGAVIQIDKQPSIIPNYLPVPSLHPFSVTVSAPGYRVQTLNLGPFDPGTVHTQVVDLARMFGALRIEATVPTNAQAYFQGLDKQIRLDSNDWKTVKALPALEEYLTCEAHPVELQVAGFEVGRGVPTEPLVRDGQTTTVSFVLSPLPATLKVTCNVTGVVIQINDQPSTVSNSFPVPSLQPLSVTVSATGYVAQVVKLGPMEPGKAYRQEVKLESLVQSSGSMGYVPRHDIAKQLQPLTAEACQSWVNDIRADESPVPDGLLQQAVQRHHLFLYMFSDHPQAGEISKQLEELELVVARRADTPVSWKRFRLKYPNSQIPGVEVGMVGGRKSSSSSFPRGAIEQKAFDVLAEALRETEKNERNFRINFDNLPYDNPKRKAAWEEVDASLDAARWAARGLAEVGSANAVETLRGVLMGGYSFNFRRNVMEALGCIGTSQALGALEEVLASTNSFYLTEGLRAVKSPESFDFLMKVLGRGSKQERESAAEALGRLGDERAVDALVKMLMSCEEPSQAHSLFKESDDYIEALGEIGGSRAVAALVDILLLNKHSIYSDLEVQKALGRCGYEQVSNKLIPLTNHADAEIRRNAIRALGMTRDPRATEVAIKALGDTNSTISDAGANALQDIQDPRSLPALLDAIGDANPKTPPYDEFFAIGRIGDRRVVPVLISIISSSNSFLKNWALQPLGMVEDPQATPALIEVLTKDADERNQTSAIHALGFAGDHRGVEPLIRAFSSSRSWHYRNDCAGALSRIGDSNALDVVVGHFLASSSELETSISVRHVEKLGDSRAVPTLLNALGKKDSGIANALGELGDVDVANKLMDYYIRELPTSMEGSAVIGGIFKIALRYDEAFLLQALNHRDKNMRCLAASILANLADPQQELTKGYFGMVGPKVPKGGLRVVDGIREEIYGQKVLRTEVTKELGKALSDDDIRTRVHAARALLLRFQGQHAAARGEAGVPGR